MSLPFFKKPTTQITPVEIEKPPFLTKRKIIKNFLIFLLLPIVFILIHYLHPLNKNQTLTIQWQNQETSVQNEIIEISAIPLFTSHEQYILNQPIQTASSSQNKSITLDFTSLGKGIFYLKASALDAAGNRKKINLFNPSLVLNAPNLANFLNYLSPQNFKADFLIAANPETASPEVTEEVTLETTLEAIPEATEEISEEPPLTQTEITPDLTSTLATTSTPELMENSKDEETTPEVTEEVTLETTLEAIPEATEEISEEPSLTQTEITPDPTSTLAATSTPELMENSKDEEIIITPEENQIQINETSNEVTTDISLPEIIPEAEIQLISQAQIIPGNPTPLDNLSLSPIKLSVKDPDLTLNYRWQTRQNPPLFYQKTFLRGLKAATLTYPLDPKDPTYQLNATAFEIGFPFNFYTETYSRIFVDPKGFLSFTPLNGNSREKHLGPIISPLGLSENIQLDPFSVKIESQLTGEAPQRILVIRWAGTILQTNEPFSAEVHLFETDNSIRFVYISLPHQITNNDVFLGLNDDQTQSNPLKGMSLELSEIAQGLPPILFKIAEPSFKDVPYVLPYLDSSQIFEGYSYRLIITSNSNQGIFYITSAVTVKTHHSNIPQEDLAYAYFQVPNSDNESALIMPVAPEEDKETTTINNAPTNESVTKPPEQTKTEKSTKTELESQEINLPIQNPNAVEEQISTDHAYQTISKMAQLANWTSLPEFPFQLATENSVLPEGSNLLLMADLPLNIITKLSKQFDQQIIVKFKPIQDQFSGNIIESSHLWFQFGDKHLQGISFEGETYFILPQDRISDFKIYLDFPANKPGVYDITAYLAI